MNIIEKAKTKAQELHTGILDDNGEDYFEAHLCVVAEIIKLVCPQDENLIASAYLHDTIEDTEYAPEVLLEEFGEDVHNLVMEVSHEGKKDYKGFWFPRLKTQRGILLKFADRTSNLSRMEAWDQKRIDQYLRKSKFWKDA